MRSIFAGAVLTSISALAILLLGSMTMILAETPGAIPASTNFTKIPIKLLGGRVMLAASMNDGKKVALLLDSGCTIPTIKPELMDELKIEPAGRVRINGIAGMERAPTYPGVTFDFGSGIKYSPRRVASVPSERGEKRRRDGVIGSGFYERFVIEFEPGANHLKVYPPNQYSYHGKGTIVPFRLHDEIPVIKAVLLVINNVTLEGEFEIDTGCDSGICIGETFVRKHKLHEILAGKESEKFGLGGSVETLDATIPKLTIHSVQFGDVQGDLFMDGSPVDEPLAGHIGAGVFKQRKVIYDYARKRIIFE